MNLHKVTAPVPPTPEDNGPSSSSGLHPDRLQRAKSAYTTRFVAERVARDANGYRLISGHEIVPRAGDVVLATVLELGQHLRIERPDSRRAVLFEGDEI